MAPDDTGLEQRSAVEWRGARSARWSGRDRETLKPGDVVVITGKRGGIPQITGSTW
jgi:hypothetical protein